MAPPADPFRLSAARSGLSFCRVPLLPPTTDWFSPAAISPGFVNLPTAGPCLRVHNAELRVLHPARLGSYFHTRAKSLGCHPEACRSLCPSPEQKPARSRTHHPTHWLPLASSQLKRGKTKEENLATLPDAVVETPSPAALVPRQLCLTARKGGVGSGRLPCAPRELFHGPGPGAAKTGASVLQG